MNKVFAILFFQAAALVSLYGQSDTIPQNKRKAITFLVAQYATARENSDTVLLKAILTADIDQLVSTGEWRMGIGTAIRGMLKSAATKPGTRTLTVYKIRLLNATTAIVDCRYDIQNTNNTVRHMWSTFAVVVQKKKWKISAIRNMMPVGE